MNLASRMESVIVSFTALTLCIPGSGCAPTKTTFVPLELPGRAPTPEPPIDKLAKIQSLRKSGEAALEQGNISDAERDFGLAWIKATEPNSRAGAGLLAEIASLQAVCAHEAGRYEDAHRFLETALRQAELPDGDPLVAAKVRCDLGRLYLTLAELRKAEEYLRSGHQQMTDLQGPQHRDTLRIMLDFAALARERGRYGEARDYCDQAIQGLVAALGEDDLDVGLARLEAALVFNLNERVHEAAAEAKAARQILGSHLKAENPSLIEATIRTAILMARAAKTDSEREEVQTLFMEAQAGVETLKSKLGDDDLKVVRAEVQLADFLLHKPETRPQALETYQNAEKTMQKSLGDNHIELAHLRSGMGSLLLNLGKPEEAVTVYSRALEALDPVFKNHPIRAHLLEGLGEVLDSQGRPEEAGKLYDEAFSILSRCLGSDHPRVQQFWIRLRG